MNIENGAPFFPYFYNSFYQFPAQTFFNNGEKENGTTTAAMAGKICVACAEGMYCAVVASLISTSVAAVTSSVSHDQSPQQSFIGSSLTDGIRSGKSGSNESQASIESIIQREILKEIAAANAVTSETLSRQTIPQHHEEVYMKHEPSKSQQQQHYNLGEKRKRPEKKPKNNNNDNDKIIPALDENGIRKRYSRFRSKNHVCDFCNKSFTLKQNVQTHMSLYHMSAEPVQRPIAISRRKNIIKQEP